jgi:DnaK suppressor protein
MTEKTARNAVLREMLGERRRAIEDIIRNRIRHGRADRSTDVGDNFERSDAGIQEGIEFSLLQVQAETLARIDEALLRLDAGTYGYCVECDREIAEPRLRAVPFAVRCQSCEERREEAQADARRRASVSLFAAHSAF